MPTTPLGRWLLAASLATLAVWGWDKWRAVRGGRRVPERTLLLLALVGGFPGAWAGVLAFRHKRSKPRFLWPLLLASLVSIAILWWIFAPDGAPLAPAP